MAQSILYYPTINIEDSAWLRSAILYWDEINSIVPYEDYCDLSPELLFLENIGQYKPIYPEEIFVLGDPHEFSSAVKRFFYHNSSNIHNGKRGQPLTERIYNPDLVSLIYYKKLPSETLELFTKHEGFRMNDNGWIEMSSDFAMQYMRLLAEFAATYSFTDTVVGTNQVSKIREIYPQGSRTANRSAVSILLEKCLPIPTMDVGLEDLIYFKEHNRDSFLQLQRKIREFEKAISESESIAQLKDTTAAFREDWEHELIHADKMFKDKKITFILGSLRSFVTDAGAVAGLSQWAQENGVLNIPATAVGAAVGMAGLVGIGAYSLLHKNQISQINDGNSFAYVISAKREGLLRRADTIDVI